MIKKKKILKKISSFKIFSKIKRKLESFSEYYYRRCNMLILNNSELMNIYGGRAGFALPNFDAYIKIFNLIYKTVKSWF